MSPPFASIHTGLAPHRPVPAAQGPSFLLDCAVLAFIEGRNGEGGELPLWAPDPLSSASIHDVVRALLKVMEKAGSVSAERVRDTLQCLGREFNREEFANVTEAIHAKTEDGMQAMLMDIQKVYRRTMAKTSLAAEDQDNSKEEVDEPVDDTAD